MNSQLPLPMATGKKPAVLITATPAARTIARQPARVLPAPKAASSVNWKSSLRRGDVVWFPFPTHNGEHSDTRPKHGPCLVLDVFSGRQLPTAKVAYGTTMEVGDNRGYDIRVQSPEARERAGLDRPTRFDCSRTLTVSLNHPGFESIQPGTTPVIGCLDDLLAARMNAVRARLDAEADMAAEARKQQQRWQREGSGFREWNRSLHAAHTFNSKGVQK